MNIAVNGHNSAVTITLDGYAKPSELTIHPANLGTLDPANPNNPYDEVGYHHNAAIETAMEKLGGLSNAEEVRAIISEYCRGIRFKSNAIRVLAERAPMRTPYDTIFWPPIPDWLLQQEFADAVGASEDFNPATTAYTTFKRQLVEVESRYYESFEKSADAPVILGGLSVTRWSMALWTRHHIQLAQQMHATGQGNGQEVIHACNRVARADRRAFRASMRFSGHWPDAVGSAAQASAEAELSMSQRIVSKKAAF